MKELMLQYKQTADILYQRIKQIENDESRRYVLIAEYQHARKIRKHLESYCKARGLL